MLTKTYWFFYTLWYLIRNAGELINSIRENTVAITALGRNMQDLDNRNERTIQWIQDRTEVHCDVHHLSASQVIVVGHYLNRDYVRAFEVHEKALPDLIKILQEEERCATVGRMDLPMGGMDFSAVYPHARF